ncbi:MAG TPA: hypothetical protein VEB42_16480, partial [Chitinophagaceae bacterium]|nr:hypothetical protein [Chitinophagaceae bacterium]
MPGAYITFNTPTTVARLETKGYFRRTTRKLAEYILKKIFPLANPDLEDKIDLVATWYVECDERTGVPEREMGLGEGGQLVLKLPDENNMG